MVKWSMHRNDPSAPVEPVEMVLSLTLLYNNTTANMCSTIKTQQKWQASEFVPGSLYWKETSALRSSHGKDTTIPQITRKPSKYPFHEPRSVLGSPPTDNSFNNTQPASAPLSANTTPTSAGLAEFALS